MGKGLEEQLRGDSSGIAASISALCAQGQEPIHIPRMENKRERNYEG